MWKRRRRETSLNEQVEKIFSERVEVALDGDVVRASARAFSDAIIENAHYDRVRGRLLVEAGGIRAWVGTFDENEAQQIETMCRLGETRVRLLGVGGRAMLVGNSEDWTYWCRVESLIVE